MDKRISNFSAEAYIRRYTLNEGRENGLNVVEVFNGRLRFLLNESKALDMMQLFDGSLNFAFISKNGFTARETPFIKRFEGGMLYTVGLDSAGGREGFEVHGTLHNIPAKITETACDENIIRVTAEIEDTELFGKDLLLRRTVTTKAGSESVSVSDTLVNRGTKDENYCLLYHVNLGYPFLDEGVLIKSDADTVIPRTEYAEKCLGERTVFKAPCDNEEERCYFLKNKTPHIEAYNKKIGKTFVMDYSGDTLPNMVQWNSNASRDYALGLEPSTTMLDDRFEYSTIKPGDSIDFGLTFTVR